MIDEKASYTKKVALNTIVQVVGKIITTATSLILVTSLTRYLGVEGYGQFTTIFAYVAFFAVFADLGFFWIMIREISKTGAKIKKIVNNIMTLRAALGLVVFLLGFGVAFLVPSYDATIRYGIGIISFGWFWITLNSTYVGVFQAKHRMDKATITDIIGRVIILALVLYFIKLDYSLLAITSAYTVGNIVNFLGSVALGYTYVPFKLAFDLTLWKQMFREALPMGIVLVLGVIYMRIDSVMLSMMKGSYDVGIYGAPFKILEILVLVPGIFLGNVFPVITKYYEENSPKLYSAIQKSFDFLVVIALPVVVGVMLTATPIIRFIAGDQFLEASTIAPIFGHIANSAMVLQFLIISTGIMYISQIFSNTAVAIGKQREIVWPNIVFAIGNVILNLLLIPKLSYIGASIATIITQFLVLVLIWKIVGKHLPKLKLDYRVFYKAILCVAIMGLVVYLSRNLNLFVVITLAAAVYMIMVYITGIYNKETLKLILKK